LVEKVKVSCLNCGATNNYPMDAQGKSVLCGRCKTSLPQPGTVIGLQPQQLHSFIQRANLPILIDFFSPTCAPCHIMHSIVDGLAKRRAGELMVLRVDVSISPEVGASFGVQAVPTFVVLHKGYERGRVSGAMSETDFSLWVASKT
jgi:thioredoxin 2